MPPAASVRLRFWVPPRKYQCIRNDFNNCTLCADCTRAHVTYHYSAPRRRRAGLRDARQPVPLVKLPPTGARRDATDNDVNSK